MRVDLGGQKVKVIRWLRSQLNKLKHADSSFKVKVAAGGAGGANWQIKWNQCKVSKIALIRRANTYLLTYINTGARTHTHTQGAVACSPTTGRTTFVNKKNSAMLKKTVKNRNKLSSVVNADFKVETSIVTSIDSIVHSSPVAWSIFFII